MLIHCELNCGGRRKPQPCGDLMCSVYDFSQAVLFIVVVFLSSEMGNIIIIISFAFMFSKVIENLITTPTT